MPLHRHAVTPHVAGMTAARVPLSLPSQSVVLFVSAGGEKSFNKMSAEPIRLPNWSSRSQLKYAACFNEALVSSRDIKIATGTVGAWR